MKNEIILVIVKQLFSHFQVSWLQTNYFLLSASSAASRSRRCSGDAEMLNCVQTPASQSITEWWTTTEERQATWLQHVATSCVTPTWRVGGTAFWSTARRPPFPLLVLRYCPHSLLSTHDPYTETQHRETSFRFLIAPSITPPSLYLS